MKLDFSDSLLNEVAEKTLEKLNEMNPEIAGSLTPVIPSPDGLKWVDVFKSVSITGDEDIPINKRGSGVRDCQKTNLLIYITIYGTIRAKNWQLF